MANMKLFALFFICTVCASESSPVSNTKLKDVLKSPRFDLDLITGIRDLIMELMDNMGDAVTQGGCSIETFTTGLESEFTAFAERVETRIDDFKESIADYIESFFEMVSEVNDTVKDCIEDSQETAQDLYTQTLDSVKQCGSIRVEAISEMISSLAVLTDNSSVVIQEVVTDVDFCYNTTGNDVITLAHCLAAVVIDAELKATGFMAQFGYQTWQINTSIATLPAALEVCAGAGFVSAGIDTGKVFSEIASCITSSTYEYLASNITVDYNKINSTLFTVSKL